MIFSLYFVDLILTLSFLMLALTDQDTENFLTQGKFFNSFVSTYQIIRILNPCPLSSLPKALSVKLVPLF